MIFPCYFCPARLHASRLTDKARPAALTLTLTSTPLRSGRVLPQMLNLQWDALLLESGAYAAILALSMYPQTLALAEAPEAPVLGGLVPGARPTTVQLYTQRVALLLLKLLVFRLFFGSGLVKLTSGDRNWRAGTALYYHFQTQPLPTPLAPWLHRLPRALLRGMCQGTLLVETLLPLLVLLLPAFGDVAAALYALLQLAIMLAGNYGFFNLLTIVLCTSLCACRGWGAEIFDWAFPLFSSPAAAATSTAAASTLTDAAATANDSPVLLTLRLFLLTLCACLLLGHVAAVCALLKRSGMIPSPPEPVAPAASELAAGLRLSLWSLTTHIHSVLLSVSLCCHYGLFATMTTVRDEVEVEVSLSGATGEADWTPVRWKCKPSYHDERGGGLRFLFFPSLSSLCPPFHMPRIDWRLWFVSLNAAREAREASAEATATAGSGAGVGFVGESEVGGKVTAPALLATPAAAHLHVPVWLNVLLIGVLERHAGILSLLGENPSLAAGPRGAAHDSTKERIRVRLVRYVFSAGPTSWETSYTRLILPPTSLEDLYILSAADDRTHSLYGKKAAMQPDTAADIIARTFQKKKLQQ